MELVDNSDFQYALLALRNLMNDTRSRLDDGFCGVETLTLVAESYYMLGTLTEIGSMLKALKDDEKVRQRIDETLSATDQDVRLMMTQYMTVCGMNLSAAAVDAMTKPRKGGTHGPIARKYLTEATVEDVQDYNWALRRQRGLSGWKRR